MDPPCCSCKSDLSHRINLLLLIIAGHPRPLTHTIRSYARTHAQILSGRMISPSVPSLHLEGMRCFWTPSIYHKWAAEVLDSSSKWASWSFIAVTSKHFLATCGVYCPSMLPGDGGGNILTWNPSAVCSQLLGLFKKVAKGYCLKGCFLLLFALFCLCPRFDRFVLKAETFLPKHIQCPLTKWKWFIISALKCQNVYEIIRQHNGLQEITPSWQ